MVEKFLFPCLRLQPQLLPYPFFPYLLMRRRLVPAVRAPGPACLFEPMAVESGEVRRGAVRGYAFV